MFHNELFQQLTYPHHHQSHRSAAPMDSDSCGCRRLRAAARSPTSRAFQREQRGWGWQKVGDDLGVVKPLHDVRFQNAKSVILVYTFWLKRGVPIMVGSQPVE